MVVLRAPVPRTLIHCATADAVKEQRAAWVQLGAGRGSLWCWQSTSDGPEGTSVNSNLMVCLRFSTSPIPRAWRSKGFQSIWRWNRPSALGASSRCVVHPCFPSWSSPGREQSRLGGCARVLLPLVRVSEDCVVLSSLQWPKGFSLYLTSKENESHGGPPGFWSAWVSLAVSFVIFENKIQLNGHIKYDEKQNLRNTRSVCVEYSECQRGI